MAKVLSGIFLEDNPPSRDQSRARRNEVQSVISIHTAESGTDFEGVDNKAENVASFIRRRTTPGSYHLVGDSDSIIQLLPFDQEAYQARGGSNRFVIAISFAMNAADWGKLTPGRRAQFVDTGGQMAAIAARWLQSQGKPIPAARRLTKLQAFKDSDSGFIDHARLDPDRRSDPGAEFPWGDFFQSYQAHLTQTGGIDTVAELSEIEQLTMDLQRLMISWGVGLGQTGPNHDGVDGDPGPTTIQGASALIRFLIRELDGSRERVALLQETNRVQATDIESLQKMVTDLQDKQSVTPEELQRLRDRSDDLEGIREAFQRVSEVLGGG